MYIILATYGPLSFVWDMQVYWTPDEAAVRWAYLTLHEKDGRQFSVRRVGD